MTIAPPTHLERATDHALRQRTLVWIFEFRMN
jgi:hypothetical protein